MVRNILKVAFLLILQTILYSSCSSGIEWTRHGDFNQEQNLNRSGKSEASWETIYFKPIRDRLQVANISDLREVTLTADSREIRIWAGFDTTPLRGIILRQSGGESSATFLPPVSNANVAGRVRILTLPKERWDELWAKLDSQGLMDLPDPADGARIDEGSVVIEVRTRDSYRPLKYSGVESNKDKEHEAVLEICETLAKEFDIELLKYFLPT